MAQIAERLGVSESRVSQLRAEAVVLMRGALVDALEPELAETHDGVLVGGNHCVVRLGGYTHECGVEDVDQQEEEDGHAGNTVGNPGPHAVLAAVKGAPG